MLSQLEAGPETAGGIVGVCSIAVDEDAAISPRAEERTSLLPHAFRRQDPAGRLLVERLCLLKSEIHLFGYKLEAMRLCNLLGARLRRIAPPLGTRFPVIAAGSSLRRLMAEVSHIEPAFEGEGIRLPSGRFHLDKGCELFLIQRRCHLVPGKGGMAGGVGAETLFQDLELVHGSPFCQMPAWALLW